jgi:O-antigen ligase
MELALVIVIDLIAIIGLIALARSKGGLERALPFAAFLLVLTPIESLLSLGFFTLTTHRIVIVMLALLYVTRSGASAAPSRNYSLPLKGLIFLHVVWCLVATANSITPVMSIKKVLSILIEYYTLYFVYWKTVTKIETVHRILIAIALALTVCSIWGTGEAYRHWNFQQYFPSVAHHWESEGDIDRGDRIHGTFDHPILFGAALAMGITVTIYLLTVVSKRSHRVVLSLGLLLMFLNIYKTSSRGPWLDVIIGFVMLLVFGKQKSRRLLLYMAALSLAVCLVRPGVWGTISGIYATTFNMETNSGSSYAYRYALQDAAVKRLSQNPTTRALWGYGPESFYLVHLEGPLLGTPWVFLSCDNAWVEFLIETGFIGLSIMVMLLLWPAWVAWKGFWKGGPIDRHLSYVLFVNLVIFYFQMYSVGMYSWGQNGYMLWIVIALVLSQPKWRKALQEQTALGTGSGEVSLITENEDRRWGRPEWWGRAAAEEPSWSVR